MQQPNDLLPIHATPASHHRYRVAQELAELCPPVLGQEISITGSVSKGLADDFSDIEQVFYVQTLPDIQERDRWLKHIGAKEIFHDDVAIEDGHSGPRFASVMHGLRQDGRPIGNKKIYCVIFWREGFSITIA